MKLIVVIPFYSGDMGLAANLIAWINELGGSRDNPCVLVTDCHLPQSDSAVIRRSALSVFKTVDLVVTPFKLPNESWPIGPNWLFETTLRHMQGRKEAFLWLEPDCVPTRRRWLQEIENEYVTHRKPFMGDIITHRGKKHLSGCAVYPKNAHQYYRTWVDKTKPWDIAFSNKVVPLAYDSQKFWHFWGKKSLPPTFRDAPHVDNPPNTILFEDIPPKAAIVHRCKDGSLINIIRSKRSQRVSSTIIDKTVVVRRMGAIGDVIMASCVPSRLHELGYSVVIQTEPACAEALKFHPHISRFEHSKDYDPTINLDGAYEKHGKYLEPIPKIFLKTANEQLEPFGITLPTINYAPTLHLQDREKAIGLDRIDSWPRPWVFVSPRSNSFAVRTVPPKIWEAAVRLKRGTWFWVGTDPAPPGFVDLKCRDIRMMMSLMAHGDVVVSVDTGPAHLAAGLGLPTVIILQASHPHLHFSAQRDVSIISAELGCLNCQQRKCPIDPISPPCGLIDPEEIAAAVERKIDSKLGQKVSAIIPIYNTRVERLNRCLSHIISQVDEIIISIDGDGSIPPGVLQSRKIKFSQNTTGMRLGFGKTMNRGVQMSSGRFLLMLNDDVYMNSGSVQKMISSAANDVGAVGCRLWYPNGTIQHGGTCRNPGDVGLGHMDHRKSAPSILVTTEMESVTFASAIVRREAFYKVMGFDERYDCYNEDVDLCLSVRQAGWKVMYEPGAEGIHDESQTSSPMKMELTAQAARLFHRKWLWYFQKNPNTKIIGGFV